MFRSWKDALGNGDWSWGDKQPPVLDDYMPLSLLCTTICNEFTLRVVYALLVDVVKVPATNASLSPNKDPIEPRRKPLPCTYA